MAALPKRIVKETERLMAEPHVSQTQSRQLKNVALLTLVISSVPGISAVPHEDNLRYFDVKIHGPSQSPYEGQSEHTLLRRVKAVAYGSQPASSSLSFSYQTTIP